MPDLLAGTTILAQDTPVTEEAEQTTDVTGISSTSYAAGATTCEITFMAPTTGRVVVSVSGRIEGDGTNRTFLSYEVYEGSDATGTLIQAANDDRAISTKTSGVEEGQGMSDRVSGLTVGATHFIRTMHRVAGGTTGAARMRRLVIEPAT